MRIAYLEDDKVQSTVMKEWLESEGFTCHEFSDADSFMRELRHETYDLLIMDWELPGKSGVEVLSWLRDDREWDLPVFFITHRDGEADIVEALERGADDYLTKPVNREIMLARVKALVRRHSTRRDSLDVGPFQLFKDTKSLLFNGEGVEMTEKEFQLAWMLFSNIGRLLSRDHLLESIWGFGPGLMTRTVDTHISRLRRKLLLTPENGWRLKAVYHQGYRLEQLEEAD
ncbi:MAG: response regulator transcription factor [Candidatus Thiodiazotropha sp. (ex Semelilucina semeliformis)]|nr:response regulator transcription factor [Candidatus Thiodiazotropha sp. (ex Myrtea spinifera)]MCU7806696.1 response regulator transcription factor [Candidatus Thiodiazotropha sp. (ex Semelilucina semeliformis)]MCU7811612.1 response regulator transcription factor [Candidatus Thiodiazotropha sp. (ex Notomyrtea botanica)]MCU7829044.1 response regulator transcription factor [Candidatus Thiodiazotropha sp. (ex Myrtea sp. 'scaly one' KF741663)]